MKRALRRGTVRWGGAAIVLAAALMIPAAAGAQDFGIGIVLGVPTGLTFKAMLDDSSAIDADLAFDFLDGLFLFTGDYLYHFSDMAPASDVVDIRFYLGGGGVIGVDADEDEDDPPWDDDDDDHPRRRGDDDDWDDDDDADDLGLGVRFTGGVSFMFQKVPIELFADISPGMWVYPETDFMLMAVLGARWFF
ncbi:hypothetical protein K8I61_18375 [bacterium]|nr:hypothetical protein [bacterium]